MATHPRTRRERLKPKRLRTRRRDHIPQINPQIMANRAISLTNAILICRYVFSNNFAVSASRVPLARTTVSINRE